MASNVTAPFHPYGTGAYPASIQPGYSTSPTGTLGVQTAVSATQAAAYSTYDNTKPFSGTAMLASYTSPTAAPQYSAAYYSNPATSLTYGQQHSSSGIYNNYTTQSHLQANTSLTAAQAQLAAASLQRGFQSPPYGTANYSSQLQTPVASVQSATAYDHTAAQLYKQVYNQQLANEQQLANAAAVVQVQAAQQQAAQQAQQQAAQQQAVQQAAQQQAAQQQAAQQAAHQVAQQQAVQQAQQQAVQQAQQLSGFQQKHDIVDGYMQASAGAARLQGNVQQQQVQHLLPTKQQLAAAAQISLSPPPQHLASPAYSHLDSLQVQSSFSQPPPAPPLVNLPPKPSPHIPPHSRMSALSLKDNRHSHRSSGNHGNSHHNNNNNSDMSSSQQHVFKRNVVTCKIQFQKTLHMHNHLCEICKVSCASSKTYKDHIEGQRHKKRVALREQEKQAEDALPASGASYKCVLCDVTCTGKETFDAHITGMKHKKAAKLYKELGKEIPPPEITGDTEPKPEVPIVGRELIETKSDATKSSKVIYHCTMCDCTFNDDLAKELHLKGRRHRLNYKKQYDPTLKVEIQPSKREKIAEQKARRRAEETERRRNMVESRRHVWEQSRWRAEEEWHEWAEARNWQQYEALKQKQSAEYEERVQLEKEHCKKMGLPEPAPPPRPHIPPPPPRQDNSHFICPRIDEFLMVQKQSMVCPKEEHLEALQELVHGVEMALRQVSDCLYSDAKEKMNGQGAAANTAAVRTISTIHKTGGLTKATLLNEDLSADIAVLCTEKPTQAILNTVFLKFKELFERPEGTNLEMVMEKAMFCVSVEESPVITVNVRLTSPAFDGAITEDERRAEFVNQVLERKYCMQTMANVNETGWYKIHFKPNTPAVIVLRILSSLRLEPQSVLKDLSVQALQVLIWFAFKTFGPIRKVAPTLIMRRFFEFLAAGYALTEELPPPWHQANTPPISLFADLDEEKRDKITEYSQYAVRCIALGQLHKVLLIPPPPNSPAFAPRS